MHVKDLLIYHIVFYLFIALLYLLISSIILSFFFFSFHSLSYLSLWASCPVYRSPLHESSFLVIPPHGITQQLSTTKTRQLESQLFTRCTQDEGVNITFSVETAHSIHASSTSVENQPLIYVPPSLYIAYHGLLSKMPSPFTDFINFLSAFWSNLTFLFFLFLIIIIIIIQLPLRKLIPYFLSCFSFFLITCIFIHLDVSLSYLFFFFSFFFLHFFFLSAVLIRSFYSVFFFLFIFFFLPLIRTHLSNYAFPKTPHHSWWYFMFRKSVAELQTKFWRLLYLLSRKFLKPTFQNISFLQQRRNFLANSRFQNSRLRSA